jgi:hypothetical protein
MRNDHESAIQARRIEVKQGWLMPPEASGPFTWRASCSNCRVLLAEETVETRDDFPMVIFGHQGLDGACLSFPPRITIEYPSNEAVPLPSGALNESPTLPVAS